MKNKRWIAALAALFSLSFAACGAPAPETLPETLSPEIREEPPAEVQPEPPRAENGNGDETGERAEEPFLPPQSEKAAYIRVLVDGLRIRKGAEADSQVVGYAEKGTLLFFAGKEGDRYETRFCGKKAYISADGRYTKTVLLEAGEERTEKIVKEGAELLGTPYVYGAVRLHDGRGNMLENFTASAFDCSSLMQYIFFKGADVLLDVTTRTQIKQGRRVEWADIRRGDLLFFTNASRRQKTGIERVGHVALYLGENYILHTSSDYAKIEKLTPVRIGDFLEARRI